MPEADSPTLKRSFVPDHFLNTSYPSKKFEPASARPPTPPHTPPRKPFWQGHHESCSPRVDYLQPPRRNRRPSMPVQASSRTFVPMPSFMSVFGEELDTTGVRDHGNSVARPASSGNITHCPSSTNAFTAFHVHRDSTSTLASESSDSSPTTTISTMDSSSVTDPSPGPSPESPIAKVAPSSFVADFRSRKVENPSEVPQATFFELQRPTTPAKKPRNLKNLGINTSSSLGNLRSHGTASLPGVAKAEQTSAPTSPSFIKPPTPPKRRPSNLSLTIQTPGSDSKPTRLIIPSTPALNRPALRHFQSSPSLPLCSPSAAPSGGMRFPPLRPIKTNTHGFAEVPREVEEDEDQEPNFDVPQSREEKPAAYPHGPICIYESGVYLYFEPTAQQAATFDVIINVASEVKNPFTSSEAISQKDLDARRVDGPPAETVDFAALPERSRPSSTDTQGNSPTTPKATPVLETVQPAEQVFNGTSYKTPEYIHMLWEHNTDIVPDLYRLVKTMDDRVQQGKRVLVHCQCGVSRSASLIVAYGLYKNPGISVQEAYDSVKKRSKWIGPNMNLIMQLQEFRNGLLRASNQNSAYHNQVHGLPRRTPGLPSAVSVTTNRRSPYDAETSPRSRTPRTAPLPPDTDMGLQRASTGNMFAISPGPLSAPSGASAFYSPGFRRSWASSQTHFDLSPKSSPTALPYVDPLGHVVPVLSITENDQSIADSAQNARPESDATIQPLPVPNFSRQLPFRSLDGDEVSTTEGASTASTIFRTGLVPPNDLAPLLSPSKFSFDGPPMKSPMRTEFTAPAWQHSDAPQSLPSSDIHAPMSPRATEFHMAGLNQGEIDESFGLLSPKGTSFDLESRPTTQPVSDLEPRSSGDFTVSSPTITEFPTDVFPPTGDATALELASPRATEFHMTPLKPKVVEEDPFGLTSPRHFAFPSSVFDGSESTPLQLTENEARRPSFQAILPPSHEAFNGFASLDGTAQVPAFAMPIPAEPLKRSESSPRMDSLSTPDHSRPLPEVELPVHVEQHTPKLASSEEGTSGASTVTERTFLSTPPRQIGIKTRFSSPNLREQRRLHKLQTEMEAMLPHKSPNPEQSTDDLDALLSPRAEEFTRNPFHFDLPTVDNDASPASSNETIKEGQNYKNWEEPQPLTPPRSVEDDPRSPVQTGSSPIVRNIWDVL